MSLKKELSDAVTQAMKDRNETRKIPLRLVMSAVKEAEIDKKEELDDEEVLRLVQKEAKARKEAIADAEKANRPDLIAQAEAELAVLEEFMPEMLSEAEIQAIVEATISETGASSMADMGNVMKAVMPKIQGRADGSMVSQMVRQKLQS
ncbi:MAG TPA: GatB/YqeY domain-containing protein [Anaerolineales bacterium]|nr:GatB/YqeY domain-containing protein [Anaerolineales bacterium]